MSVDRTESPTAFLEGGGRIGALMRSRDWTASFLGPPAGWPDTLKVAIATCLSSHFPMVIWWGPQLLMFYNDAWQPILGDTKHPHGLGRPGAESWPETCGCSSSCARVCRPDAWSPRDRQLFDAPEVQSPC